MADYAYENIKVEVRDGIGWAIMNRPEKRNAMSPQLHYDMDDALNRRAAIGAGLGVQVARELFAYRVRLGLAITPLHVGYDAFERVGAGIAAALVAEVGEAHLLVAAAVQNHLLKTTNPFPVVRPAGDGRNSPNSA